MDIRIRVVIALTMAMLHLPSVYAAGVVSGGFLLSGKIYSGQEMKERDRSEDLQRALDRFHSFALEPSSAKMGEVFSARDGTVKRMKERFDENPETFSPAKKFASIQPRGPFVEWGPYYLARVKGVTREGPEQRWLEAFYCTEDCVISDFFRDDPLNDKTKLGVSIVSGLLNADRVFNREELRARRDEFGSNMEICTHPGSSPNGPVACVTPKILLYSEFLANREGQEEAEHRDLKDAVTVFSRKSGQGSPESRLDKLKRWLEYDESYGFPRVEIEAASGTEADRNKPVSGVDPSAINFEDLLVRAMASYLAKAFSVRPAFVLDDGRFQYMFFEVREDPDDRTIIQWLPWDSQKGRFRPDIASQSTVARTLLRTRVFISRLFGKIDE